MKRVENRRYRGRKHRGGMSIGQAGLVFVLVLAAMLALTIHVNSQWTGMSAGEQLHEALFVAQDWD